MCAASPSSRRRRHWPPRLMSRSGQRAGAAEPEDAHSGADVETALGLLPLANELNEHERSLARVVHEGPRLDAAPQLPAAQGGPGLQVSPDRRAFPRVPPQAPQAAR